MTGLSSFVVQNYFWILMIGIVLIMALIGYIADKKNLVKLERKPRKSNENNEEEILQKVQEKHLADAIYDNELAENTVSTEVTDNVENQNNEEIPADLFAPMGDMTTEVENTNMETVNGMEIVNFGEIETQEMSENQGDEELGTLPNEIVEFETNEVSSNDENVVSSDISQVISETNDVPAELYAPLESTYVNPVSENNVDENSETNEINEEIKNSPIDAELPDLNSVGEESEEDVWKF